MSHPLAIRLFGPFDARLSGQPLPGLSEHRKAAQLLALLCLHHGKELGNEWVATHLWPETASIDNLKHSVSILRRALGPFGDQLVARAGKLTLSICGMDVDTAAFDFGVKAGQDDPSALRVALDLFRAPLLVDWFDDWVEPHRKAYDAKRCSLLEALAAQALRGGDYENAADMLQRLIQARPDDHAPRVRLLQVLVKSGETLAAKRLYEEYRDELREVHGLLPPWQMTELYETIPRPSVLLTVNTEPAILEEEQIGGGMPLDSSYYVVRPADRIIHSAVKRHDCIVRIQGPRQTGKTSLLARVIEQARQDGSLVVTSDFQALGPEDTATIETFFGALARQFHRTAQAGTSPTDYWDPMLSANANFQGYLRDVVFEEAKVPVVWAIDEADRIFDREYRSSVFGLFRSWHNRRALEPDEAWKRFTLIMAYSAEARMLIPNPNESPFNVGTGANLQDFTPEQVGDLNERYGSPLVSDAELASLMALVGGHPFLVRSCLYEVKTRATNLDSIVAEARSDAGVFAEHLDRIRRLVCSRPEWTQAVHCVLNGEPCTDLDAFSRLRSVGVLSGESMRSARVRCGLYEEYLRRWLG